MANKSQSIVSFANLALRTTLRPQSSAVSQAALPFACQTRLASKKAGGKKKKYKTFKELDKKKLVQYSLCDAIRYLRAFEVGRPPAGVTYDIALRVKTNKDGAVLRDRIRLPHPCNSDFRIAVICKEDSKVATDARADGAVAVGEESLLNAIKAGDINFNRLICHIDSVNELTKAGVARILGPKGLMPNIKSKTITHDVRTLMREIAGTEEYRERDGVVRIAIGQLPFTPEMVAANIRAFLAKVKENTRRIELQTPKTVDEVVLSSTNGPGFSLSGAFNPTDDKITSEHLSTAM